MNLLLVALESTDGPTQSVACQWVASLEQVEADGHDIQSLRLPAHWDACFAPLDASLDAPWDAIVIFSDKAGESIAIERMVINETDVSQKDSGGRRPRGKAIDPNGEPGFWTTLPYRELAARFTAARFAASPSHSAGMAFANFACYQLMRELGKRGAKVPAGLIQLPRSKPSVSDDEAKLFLSALLDSLDVGRRADASLRVDLDRLSQRLGTGASVSSKSGNR